MPRQNTPKLGLGYGWYMGENPGTEVLDEMRLHMDAIVQENFAYDPVLSNGLWYYYRGALLISNTNRVVHIPSGRLALNANATNYIYRNAAGVVALSTTEPVAPNVLLGIAVTSSNAITSQTDMRASNTYATDVLFASSNDLIQSGSVQTVLTQLIDYVSTLLVNVRRTIVHEQVTPLAVWTIVHDLKRFPDVYLIDMSGNRYMAEIDYPDYNTVVVTHGSPETGRAFLSYSLGSDAPVFETITPSAVWLIVHDLENNPDVFAVDFEGNTLECEVDYPSAGNIVITFAEPQSGRCYLK